MMVNMATATMGAATMTLTDAFDLEEDHREGPCSGSTRSARRAPISLDLRVVGIAGEGRASIAAIAYKLRCMASAGLVRPVLPLCRGDIRSHGPTVARRDAS